MNFPIALNSLGDPAFCFWNTDVPEVEFSLHNYVGLLYFELSWKVSVSCKKLPCEWGHDSTVLSHQLTWQVQKYTDLMLDFLIFGSLRILIHNLWNVWKLWLDNMIQRWKEKNDGWQFYFFSFLLDNIRFEGKGDMGSPFICSCFFSLK